MYVSYYTGAYESRARQLVASLDAFALPHDVRAVQDTGTWIANCQHKPAFISEMMECYPGSSVVWLDADAQVKQKPELFDTLDCDFAAHWFGGTQLNSATLYFAPTNAARKLLDDWAAQNKANPQDPFGDQTNLQTAVEQSTDLRVTRLPPGYALIFDTMAGVAEPVILQTQASRRLRK